MMRITVCPTCGSEKVKVVRRSWHGNFRGRPYRVPSLAFHACPVCGEKLFGPEAMKRIEAARRASGGPARVRSSRKREVGRLARRAGRRRGAA